MKIRKNQVYAIVTGDVVSSSKLSSKRRQELHSVMVKSSASARKAFGDALPADVDIYRGDGWQMLIADPKLSLRVALFYRAKLRALMESHHIDTRISIALGAIDFVPGDRVSEGDGTAYRRSGAGLEQMAKSQHMCFAWPESDDEEALNILALLVDGIASRWTDKQALAVTGALQGWKQQEIARKAWSKPVKQPTIARHLDRAHWDAVEQALAFYERRVAGNIP